MQPFISPSKLNTQVRWLLETSYPLVYIQGEVSEWKLHSNGHIYFTVKDSKAYVKGILFSSYVQPKIHSEIVVGSYIFISGKISLYDKTGSYQILGQFIQKNGIGILNEEFETIKLQLEKEGLFDQSRKKIIPSYPSLIGVLASLNSAALKDFLTLAKARFPHIPILVFPISTQGTQALEHIFNALEKALLFPLSSLLITRGGGESEDLSLFNHEQLARTIAQYPIPVVSAIGHEKDTTLLDLVADQRASTPSHAASIMLPSQDLLKEILSQQINQIQQDLIFSLKNSLQQLELYQPQSFFQEIQSTLFWYQEELTLNFHPSFLSKAIQNDFFSLKQELDLLHQNLTLNQQIQLEQEGNIVETIQHIQKNKPLIIHLMDGILEAQVLNFKISNKNSEDKPL